MYLYLYLCMYINTYIHAYVIHNAPLEDTHAGVSKTGFSKSGFMDVYSLSSVVCLTLSMFMLLGNNIRISINYDNELR